MTGAIAAWRYPNARDLAAALIHRLGRAVDTHQVVAMLAAAGASLNSLRQPYVQRRDLIQRERDGGHVRVGHVKYDGLAVFHPAGVMTPQQALADYAAQRRAHPTGRLPIPAPGSSSWCPCPYCTPTTSFTTVAAPTTKSSQPPGARHTPPGATITRSTTTTTPAPTTAAVPRPPLPAPGSGAVLQDHQR